MTTKKQSITEKSKPVSTFGAELNTEILLVRHGQQTTATAKNITEFYKRSIGDQVDPPLSELGNEQAKLVGQSLSTTKIDAVYASPLKRAFITGEQIARHHDLKPIVIHDLREVEMFRDSPQDLSAEEVFGKQALTAMRSRMAKENSWDVYPQSERSHELRQRVVTAIEGIIIENIGKRVVVAAHGGVINAYLGHLLKTPLDMLFRPAHTSISIILASKHTRIIGSLNDVYHLKTEEKDYISG